jgi:hypothetical protein
MDENQNTDRGFGEVEERELPENETEDTQDEQLETDSDESSETESEGADDQQDTEGNEDEGEEEDSQETKLTERGTKLDPNPKSAVHQQLANERRIRGQMEQVLADPQKIAQFVKQQYGIDMNLNRGNQQTDANSNQATDTKPTVKRWTAKDFESLEDVAEKFNGLQEQFESEISKRDGKIEELTRQLGGIQEGGRITQIADNLEKDASTLRSVPELNPKSPDFIEGLEEEIGALYHKLDFDEKTGMYRGNYSLKELGEDIIATARKARKAGSKQAQTIVKDKTGGRIRTGGSTKKGVNTDNLPPGQSIAQGIAKMFNN